MTREDVKNTVKAGTRREKEEHPFPWSKNPLHLPGKLPDRKCAIPPSVEDKFQQVIYPLPREGGEVKGGLKITMSKDPQIPFKRSPRTPTFPRVRVLPTS
jgi:hypothetical protein